MCSRCWSITRSTPASASSESWRTASVGVADQAGHHRQRERLAFLARARVRDALLQLAAFVRARRDGVVLVRPARGERDASGPAAAAHDQRRMRRLDGLRVWVGVGKPVVLALERERLTLPLPVNHLELLGEDVHALARRGEREAVVLVLRPVPARPHPHLDPSARDLVDGHGGLGEHRRMPEGRRRHERAQPQRRGHRGETGQRRPGIERAAFLRAHDGAVVVGAEQRLVPVLLARARERNPVVPGHALLALDHHAQPHSWNVPGLEIGCLGNVGSYGDSWWGPQEAVAVCCADGWRGPMERAAGCRPDPGRAGSCDVEQRPCGRARARQRCRNELQGPLRLRERLGRYHRSRHRQAGVATARRRSPAAALRERGRGPVREHPDGR